MVRWRVEGKGVACACIGGDCVCMGRALLLGFGGGWAGGRGLRGLRWRGHASAGGLWCVVVALVWWPYWQASAICGSVVCPIQGRGVRGACAGCGPCRGVHVVMGVRCCAPQWAWRVAAGAILEGVSYLELLGGVACSGAGAVGWRAWQA